MSPDNNPDVQYIRRTCLLQAAATMFTSSQYHCGEQCKLLDDIFQEIERETGWNSNHAVEILGRLWEHYKITESVRVARGGVDGRSTRLPHKHET